MAEHPIEGLMNSAMENIKEMVDVNTIVGDPVETPTGEVIIPISRVSFGFAAGGGEFLSKTKGKEKEKEAETKGTPFAGGSGAGVSLNPVAFLVVGNEQVRLLPVTSNAAIERIINVAPELLHEFKDMLNQKNSQNKN